MPANALIGGAVHRDGIIYVKHSDVLEIVKSQEMYLRQLKVVTVVQLIVMIACAQLLNFFLSTTSNMTLLVIGKTITVMLGVVTGMLLTITVLFYMHQKACMSTLKDPDWENLPEDHGFEVLSKGPNVL